MKSGALDSHLHTTNNNYLLKSPSQRKTIIASNRFKCLIDIHSNFILFFLLIKYIKSVVHDQKIKTRKKKQKRIQMKLFTQFYHTKKKKVKQKI